MKGYGKKVNTIILLVLILMLLVPLSARGQFGTSGSGRRGSGLPWGWLIVSLLGGSSHNTPNLTPATKSLGVLLIKVTTEGAKLYKDAEVYIDERFIDLVRDFRESVIVSVPSGDHLLEFRYSGSSDLINVSTVQGVTTTVLYSFNALEAK